MLTENRFSFTQRRFHSSRTFFSFTKMDENVHFAGLTNFYIVAVSLQTDAEKLFIFKFHLFLISLASLQNYFL